MQLVLVVCGILVIAVSLWSWRTSGEMSTSSAVGVILLAAAAMIGNRSRRPRGKRPE